MAFHLQQYQQILALTPKNGLFFHFSKFIIAFWFPISASIRNWSLATRNIFARNCGLYCRDLRFRICPKLRSDIRRWALSTYWYQFVRWARATPPRSSFSPIRWILPGSSFFAAGSNYWFDLSSIMMATRRASSSNSSTWSGLAGRWTSCSFIARFQKHHCYLTANTSAGWLCSSLCRRMIIDSSSCFVYFDTHYSNLCSPINRRGRSSSTLLTSLSSLIDSATSVPASALCPLKSLMKW